MSDKDPFRYAKPKWLKVSRDTRRAYESLDKKMKKRKSKRTHNTGIVNPSQSSTGKRRVRVRKLKISSPTQDLRHKINQKSNDLSMAITIPPGASNDDIYRIAKFLGVMSQGRETAKVRSDLTLAEWKREQKRKK